MKPLDLDANASAAVHPDVLETYVRVSREAPANPSSLHRPGRRAQGVLEDARERIAACLGCAPRELIFTAGATEANNLALLGAARAQARLRGTQPALAASAAEHPAALAPLRLLQQDGHTLKLAPIDACARVDVSTLAQLAHDHAAGVVTLQWANNETGAVQDVVGLMDALPDDAHFHCDAVQGLGKLAWEPQLLRAHSLAFSGHKIRAPKGVGLLRLREDAFVDPVLTGGGQQRKLRPGTENPAGAAALAHAVELACTEQATFAEESSAAARACEDVLRDAFPQMLRNHPSSLDLRLPNTLNVSFPKLDGRALLPACDIKLLALSSGAACSSGAAQPSSVLLACGLSEDLARATVRISFAWRQNETLGREAGERLRAVVQRLYEHANR